MKSPPAIAASVSQESAELPPMAVRSDQAHNRNVLHRDLKPAHFILTDDGTLKILAFGIAKVFPPPPSHVPAIGSSAYLPPEIASGKPLTRRSEEAVEQRNHSILELFPGHPAGLECRPDPPGVIQGGNLPVDLEQPVLSGSFGSSAPVESVLNRRTSLAISSGPANSGRTLA